MASRTKQYDQNRFRKVYPRFRAEPKPGLKTTGYVALESVIVNFNNEEKKSLILEGPYSEIPGVTISPLGDINNVNVFITGVSLSSVPAGPGRTCTVTIEASAKFTGKVHLQAMQA